MTPRPAKEIVQELFGRLEQGDDSAIDDLMADDMVNHAAGPQGRQGWRAIVSVIDHDLADRRIEHHAFIGEDQLVAHHMTIHGVHRASTMPLWHGAPVTGAAVAWRYIHLWRTEDGRIVEHWACRDDLGVLTQLGLWSPRG